MSAAGYRTGVENGPTSTDDGDATNDHDRGRYSCASGCWGPERPEQPGPGGTRTAGAGVPCTQAHSQHSAGMSEPTGSAREEAESAQGSFQQPGEERATRQWATRESQGHGMRERRTWKLPKPCGGRVGPGPNEAAGL